MYNHSSNININKSALFVRVVLSFLSIDLDFIWEVDNIHLQMKLFELVFYDIKRWDYYLAAFNSVGYENEEKKLIKMGKDKKNRLNVTWFPRVLDLFIIT